MILNALLMLAYVCVSTFGLCQMKLASEVMKLQFLVGFAAYVVGFCMWFFILMRSPLSLAFPIAAGGLIVATQIAGYLFLSERITSVHGLGIAFILIGITLIGSQATANGA